MWHDGKTVSTFERAVTSVDGLDGTVSCACCVMNIFEPSIDRTKESSNMHIEIHWWYVSMEPLNNLHILAVIVVMSTLSST